MMRVGVSSEEAGDVVDTYTPPPYPLGAVHSVNRVFVPSLLSILSLALSPSDTHNAPPFPDSVMHRVKVACLDDELVIEIVCVDVRSAFNTAPLSDTVMFSNVDPSMVSAAVCVSVITDFDRLIDPSFDDGLTVMQVSVSVPADASNTDPAIILSASAVSVKVSEVMERVAAPLTTKREVPSVNLLTALDAIT